ncbi:MAG: TonB-dependent receptor [Niabella sp.]|nr:TonB-dependent receptor [Niabella sp.]
MKMKSGLYQAGSVIAMPRLRIGLLLCCGFLWNAAYAQSVQYDVNPDSSVRVAYGTLSKDQNNAAISSVTGSELKKTQTATLTNALAGKLTGLTVTNTGAAPGFDDPSVLIRGQHTSLNNGILLIVDGIQVNSISFLLPDEIESVSVLKDAAAVAMYGARGGNGVLLVTTKRGTISDKPQISLNMRYGMQSPTQLPKMASSYDFARLYNEALQNDGLSALYTDAQLEGYRQKKDPYRYPDVNWMDEILRKQAPIQDYTVSFNGGNQTAKYFVMLGFLNNQGLYAHTDGEHNANIGYNQLNLRANLDVNLTKTLSAQVGIGGNIQDRKFPPVATATFWQNMLSYAPNLYPATTPDGNITGTAAFPSNPLGDLLKMGYQSRHDRNIQMNIRVTQQLDFMTKGLNVFGAVLFDNLLQNRYDKTRTYAYYEPIWTKGASGQDSMYYLQRSLDTDLSVVTGGDYENNRIIFQGGLDYGRRFGEHELGGMVFFQQDKYTVLGNASPFAMQNLAGRLTYGYKDKYFAEGVFSYSGLENYAPGKRFGFFPALSAGWLMHKESFLQNAAWINYLKLRASAGSVGNDKGSPRFNYNQYWGVASSQGYYFGTGQSWYNGLVQLAMANPDITWERAMIYNLGVDATLFNSRLSLTADLFKENRKDILVDRSATGSALAGYTSGRMANLGKVNSGGVEIAATYRKDAGEVNYYLGGQFSYAHNIIKESWETPKKEAYSYRQGHPTGQYFGLEAIGYFKDESDIASSPLQTFSIVAPGDLKYKDQNNDGIIDVNDQIAIGKQNYPEINYGFQTGVSYKNIYLDLFFQGVADKSVYLSGYLFQPFINNANILNWAVDGHWTPQTQATATYPRLTTQANPNNYQASTFWVRNADFLRLRNVELGYRLPVNLVKRVGMEQAKIFVSGMNLVTWDNLAVDVDPEMLGQGYPVLKSWSAGIMVKF